MHSILLLLSVFIPYVFADLLVLDNLDNPVGWINNITSGPGIFARNGTNPLCPAPGIGCIELKAHSDTEKVFGTTGYSNISLNFTTSSDQKNAGDFCRFLVSESGGPFATLPEFFTFSLSPVADHSLNGVTVKLQARSNTSNLAFSCFFSQLIISGRPLISPTLIGTTFAPTLSPIPIPVPTIAPTEASGTVIWADALSGSLSPPWTEQDNGLGSFANLTGSGNCSFNPGSWCWRLKPEYQVDFAVIDTTSFTDIELHYTMKKLGAATGKCQILLNGFEQAFIQNVSETRIGAVAVTASGIWDNPNVIITLSAWDGGAPTSFNCFFADLSLSAPIVSFPPTLTPTSNPFSFTTMAPTIAWPPSPLGTLSCGGSVNGSFLLPDSPDRYYTFSLADYYEVTVDNCVSAFDPDMRIFDANGAEISLAVCGGDDCGPSPCPSNGAYNKEIISMKLGPGTYYVAIGVVSQTGFYRIDASCSLINRDTIFSDTLTHDLAYFAYWSYPTLNAMVVTDINCPLRANCTKLTANCGSCQPASMDVNIDVNNYFGMELDYSMAAFNATTGSCIIQYSDDGGVMWYTVRKLNGTMASSGTFLFNDTSYGDLQIMLIALFGSHSCYFNDINLYGYNLLNGYGTTTTWSPEVTYCWGHYGVGGGDLNISDPSLQWCCSACNCRDLSDGCNDCNACGGSSPAPTSSGGEVTTCWGHYGVGGDDLNISDPDMQWCCSSCDCTDLANACNDCNACGASPTSPTTTTMSPTSSGGEVTVCWGHYGPYGGDWNMSDPNMQWCCSSCNCRDLSDSCDCLMCGGGGGDGMVYPITPVFCPWVSSEAPGLPTQFCSTDIYDYDAEVITFVAEFYECINETAIRRKNWTDIVPVDCSGKTFTSEEIVAVPEFGGDFSVGMAYNGTEVYTFDCSNYASYDIANPPCNIAVLHQSEGCDANGALFANKSSVGIITDVCWDFGGMYVNTHCEPDKFSMRFGSDCTSADFLSWNWTLGCDVADPGNGTVAIDFECIQGDVPTYDYSPAQFVPCQYFASEWGYWLQPIGSCAAEKNMSHKVECSGLSALTQKGYTSMDCTGKYNISAFDVMSFGCDAYGQCDIFSYAAYDSCEAGAPISGSGEFILGVCMTNSFDSHETFCDADSVQILFYDEPDCAGPVNMTKSQVYYMGCNEDSNYEGPVMIEGTCDYVMTTTTTTPAPVAAGVSVAWKWTKPNNTASLKPLDPYDRFTTDIRVYIDDADGILNVGGSDFDTFFVWQIKNLSAAEPTWIDIDPYTSFIPDRIQVNNRIIGSQDAAYDGGTSMMVKSSMTIDSLRSKSCLNTAMYTVQDHIFQQGKEYAFRLKVAFPLVATPEVIGALSESPPRTVTTSTLPHSGQCHVPNAASKSALAKFAIRCTGWQGNAAKLRYNVMGASGGTLSNTYTYNISDIEGVAEIGTVQITVLVQDALNHIKCYPMSVTFQSQEDYTEENVNDYIDVVGETLGANGTDLGENLALATAISASTNTFYDAGLMGQEEATYINTEVIINIVTTSRIFTPRNETDAPVEVVEITNVVVAFTVSTSNTETINVTGGAAELFEALPDLILVMDEFIIFTANDSEGGDNDAAQAVVIDLVETAFALWTNLEEALEPSDDEDDYSEGLTVEAEQLNEFVQNIADSANQLVSLILSMAPVGEVYSNEEVVLDADGNVKDVKKRGGTKFSTADSQDGGLMDQPSIVVDGQGMIMPADFSSTFLNLEVDITFSSSENNYFRQKRKRRTKSGVLTVNLYESGNSRRRARRLVSDSQIEYNASDCFPYLIAINVQNESVVEDTNENAWSLGAVGTFPSCRYWDGGIAEWNPEGCFVFTITNVTVVCACTHLTSFAIEAEDFIPEANILTFDDLRDITPENLIKYPVVWVVFVSFLALFIIIGYLNPNKKNEGRSIVAYEDMIYHDVRKEKMQKDFTGKQVEAYSLYTPNQDKIGEGMRAMAANNKCKMCKLHWSLFKIQLRNDHTLLSVFQRTAGTNFSTRQRMACFFMYLATIIVASAAFYGVKQQAMGDITASFMMSLLSTAPVLLVKQLFLNSKPTVIASTAVEEFEDDGIEDNESDGGDVQEFAALTTTTRGEKIGQLKMSKTMINTLDIVEKQKMNTTIRAVNTALLKAQKNKSRTHRIALVESVRAVIFNQIYPLPRWCKKAAWLILIIWAIACFIVAVGYGIQFDLRYAERENWLGKCWQNFEEIVIARDLSQQQVQELQDALHPSQSDNFPGSSTKASSWLISLVQSIITSLILWQPVTVYITTLIKLWMFTWNLSMGLGPGKISALCKKCCGGEAANDDEENMARQISREVSEVSGDAVGSVVAHRNRPLDLIGFLGNDALFLDKMNEKDIQQMHDRRQSKQVQQENIELVTVEKVKVFSDSEAIVDEGGVEEEEGDGLRETQMTKGADVAEVELVAEPKRASMAVLDDIYADVLTEEENEEKEVATLYQAADDPNEAGAVIAKIQNQISLRFDIDQMAEEYFGGQGVDEIFGDDADKDKDQKEKSSDSYSEEP